MLLQSERGSFQNGLRHCLQKPSSPFGSRRSSASNKISSNEGEYTSIVTKEGAKTEHAADTKVVYEFGGPAGVTALLFGFPALMAYMYICLALHAGRLMSPLDMNFWMEGLHSMMPNARATAIYMGFTVFQFMTASTMPGIKVYGLPVPSLGGEQLEYLCNGVATWYLDLVLAAVLHNTSIFPISAVVDEIGSIISVAMIWAILVTIAMYVVGCASGRTHRMSGSVPYDMFMGAMLNPRIGNIDLKMWAEIRIPWKILFFISLSAAVKDHELNVARIIESGMSPTVWSIPGIFQMNAIQTSAPLLFMLLAHCLYVNACMKGEECIPTTWDIFYEKFGYMLIFWNLAGVPFSYCYSTLYLLNQNIAGEPIRHSFKYTTFLFLILLLAAYYVWDTANSQKNRFRMQQRGTYVERKTFPQLPWGTIKNPTYIVTKHGNKLLTGVGRL